MAESCEFETDLAENVYTVSVTKTNQLMLYGEIMAES